MKEWKRQIIESDFKKIGVDVSDLDEGTDKGRAITDAISFAQKRHDLFWYTIGAYDINFDGTENFLKPNPLLHLEEEKRAKIKEENEGYLKIFKPLDEWLSRSVFDDGVATGGQRLRYLCSLVEEGMKPLIHNELPTVRQNEGK